MNTKIAIVTLLFLGCARSSIPPLHEIKEGYPWTNGGKLLVNAITISIMMSCKAYEVLSHEFGHVYEIAKNPLKYYNAYRSQNINCREPNIDTYPYIKPARDAEERYKKLKYGDR